jgi:hypothetical protein
VSKLFRCLAILACLGIGFGYAYAEVIPQEGANEGHFKDVSQHFITPPQGELASGGPISGSTLPNVGDELRSLYRLDDLELMGSSNRYWVNRVTTGEEVTGLLYDLKVSRVVDLNNDQVIDAIYYTAGGRNPLVATDDRNRDIGNFKGSWGGVVELYRDAAQNLDATLSGGAGPNLWAPGGGPLRPNGTTHADGYPSASDGSLWMSGVLLDLTQFGDTYAQAGEIYRLTRTGVNTFSGVGYVNVFDGEALSYIQAGGEPAVGPGAGLADVSLEFTVSLGVNVWNNPNWQAGSSDPVRFVGYSEGVPEPATMLTVALGAGILGIFRRRHS